MGGSRAGGVRRCGRALRAACTAINARAADNPWGGSGAWSQRCASRQPGSQQAFWRAWRAAPRPARSAPASGTQGQAPLTRIEAGQGQAGAAVVTADAPVMTIVTLWPCGSCAGIGRWERVRVAPCRSGPIEKLALRGEGAAVAGWLNTQLAANHDRLPHLERGDRKGRGGARLRRLTAHHGLRGAG